MKKDDYVPILKTRKDVQKEAIERIELERSGKQLGLKTRWAKLNIAVGKYMRFGQVYSFNGLSGHGKSVLLNMLVDDFKNKELNKEFKDDILIVSNAFEMLPSDEVLRSASDKLGKSTLHLLSSDFDNEAGRYNTITDEELHQVKTFFEQENAEYHYYFEEPTTITGVLRNVICAVEYYKEQKVAQGDYESVNKVPTPKTVVTIDHTLLVNNEKGDNIADTMTKIGKAFVYLKKRGYMGILIGQFNNSIESPERIKNNALHFPVKSDIYYQAQIYNACDTVFTIHQPELLGITQYGPHKLTTFKLIHLQVLKNRGGRVGSIWFENALDKGKLIPTKPKSVNDQKAEPL